MYRKNGLSSDKKIEKLIPLFEQVLDVMEINRKHPDCLDTPRRIAKMYVNEIFKGISDPDFKLTVFPNSEKYNQMIVVKDIPFFSTCAHHWMPFFGTATVGYLPQNDYIGLSKIARVVEHFARRPQVQERLTTNVADFLSEKLHPRGLMVVIKARHLCMEARGVEKHSAETVTSAIKGKFDKAELMNLMQ